MSEEMRDLIFKAHDAIATGQHDVLETCFHQQVTYRRPGQGIISGLSALMKFYRQERSALTSTIIVDQIVVEGDTAVALGMVEGRSRIGAPIHERFADAFTFENGLIRDRTTYFFRHGF
jgi:ketosteroid isomerase-like protein